VKFENGKIQVFETVHNNIPPGSFIGTYARHENTLDLALQYNGKSFRNVHKIDHLGVQLGQGLWPEMHVIIRHDSPKLYIRRCMRDWGQPLRDARNWALDEIPWLKTLAGPLAN
jgi:hypothetical protein